MKGLRVLACLELSKYICTYLVSFRYCHFGTKCLQETKDNFLRPQICDTFRSTTIKDLLNSLNDHPQPLKHYTVITLHTRMLFSRKHTIHKTHRKTIENRWTFKLDMTFTLELTFR